MPAAVFGAAGGDIDNIQVFVPQHIGEAGVSAHAVHLRGLVSPLFDQIADGDQFGEGILLIGERVPFADAPRADNPNFACHRPVLWLPVLAEAVKVHSSGIDHTCRLYGMEALSTS